MHTSKQELLDRLHHQLIVSCQALEQEPLHSSVIMGRMALAAQQGGAAGIRANTPEDIREIQKTVPLPIIGLYKVVYPDSDIYITPTMREVDALAAVDPDIIALDATNRLRPGGVTLEDFFAQVRKKYPDRIFMADTSCYEEGVRAQELGFDIVGTTMAGYTAYTRDVTLPAFGLLQRYGETLHVPVIAEGGIWKPTDLKKAMDLGAWAAVVGGAITRPQEITKRFVNALDNT